ncbi:MAG: Fic family protein [Candidatus Blackburnbacteria bacterium]|nr:Fic family protein [Candidatus Blackburnbacteria bacterium]
MLIPPKYILTPKISQLLSSIEASKEVINSITIPPEVETNIRRLSTLKSSLFSARIEGNTLTLDDIQRSPSRDQKKAEVFNILKALNWVYQRRYRDLTTRHILELHFTVLGGLIERQELGKFRREVNAIFNTAGIAVYLPPPPRQISSLIDRFLKFANSNKEPFVPVRACLAHYTFEKIHPFLEGNGRVGRLILQAVLEKGGYGMKGLVPVEEYLDSNRSLYYRALDETERDVTGYLEFLLEAISETSEKTKIMVLEKQKVEIEDILLPRRAEIFNIIKDHRLVNFDIIRRRFMVVNERTLRYDLKKLTDMGLIRKRGATKGVYYEPARTP